MVCCRPADAPEIRPMETYDGTIEQVQMLQNLGIYGTMSLDLLLAADWASPKNYICPVALAVDCLD